MDDGAAYDAATDTWEKLPAPPVGRTRYSAAGVGANGKLVVFGGRRGQVLRRDGAIYDPAAGTWSAIPEAPFDVGVNAACAADEDRLFVWSGSSATGGGGGATPTGAVYEFSTRKWEKLPDAPIPPRQLAFARIGGASRTVWGGWEGSQNAFFMDAATYDCATRTWTAIPALPGDVPYEVHPGW